MSVPAIPKAQAVIQLFGYAKANHLTVRLYRTTDRTKPMSVYQNQHRDVDLSCWPTRILEDSKSYAPGYRDIPMDHEFHSAYDFQIEADGTVVWLCMMGGLYSEHWSCDEALKDMENRKVFVCAGRMILYLCVPVPPLVKLVESYCHSKEILGLKAAPPRRNSV